MSLQRTFLCSKSTLYCRIVLCRSSKQQTLVEAFFSFSRGREEKQWLSLPLQYFVHTEVELFTLCGYCTSCSAVQDGATVWGVALGKISSKYSNFYVSVFLAAVPQRYHMFSLQKETVHPSLWQMWISPCMHSVDKLTNKGTTPQPLTSLFPLCSWEC